MTMTPDERAEAMAMYKAPFEYSYSFMRVYDSHRNCVVDVHTNKNGALIAEALNEYWMKHNPPAAC